MRAMRNYDTDANKISVKKDLTFILVVKAWSVIGAILNCLTESVRGQ